jgi:hypothetical protein
MFFPLAMLYGIYFTFLPRQLLGYELEEKQYTIFPPGPVFFLLVTEKLVTKLMGKEKWYFFPYLSPMDHAVFGSPSHTVTVLRCMKMMIITLGLNVHSSACKFNDFVMNNPDNCSFNHFFFSSILLPTALLSLAIVGFIQVNTLLTTLLCFLEIQQSDGLQCSQGCVLYLLFKEIQINNACK